ncbi:MAG: hypothetical protein KGL35_05240 [Bradyrhizobium sp.]|nr:hypothetical protein [Bradyrhizobium sp.]
MLTLHSSLLMPSPLDRLSADFKSEIGIPALLTLPCTSPEAKAYDLSGNNNLGSLNGGVTTTPGGFGVLGASWSLNGTTGNIGGIPLSFSSLSQYTIAVLAKLTSVATVQALFDTSDGTHGDSILANVSATDWRWQVQDSSATAITCSTSRTDGEWVLYGISSTGQAAGQTKLYTNSVHQDDAHAISQAFGTVNIGFQKGPSNSNSRFVGGNIAFAAVWTTALSDAQHLDLYNCLLTGEPFPLFQPQTAAMMMGSAAAPAGGGILLRRRRAAA